MEAIGCRSKAEEGEKLIQEQEMQMRNECSSMTRDQVVQKLKQYGCWPEGTKATRSMVESIWRRKRDSMEGTKHHFLGQKSHSRDDKFFNLLRQCIYYQRLHELLQLEEDGTNLKSKQWLEEANENAEESRHFTRGAPDSARHPKFASGKRGATLVQNIAASKTHSQVGWRNIKPSSVEYNNAMDWNNNTENRISHRQRVSLDEDSPITSAPSPVDQGDGQNTNSFSILQRQPQRVQSTQFYQPPGSAIVKTPMHRGGGRTLKTSVVSKSTFVAVPKSNPVFRDKGLCSALNSSLTKKDPKDGTEENPISLDSDEDEVENGIENENEDGGEKKEGGLDSSAPPPPSTVPTTAPVKTRSQRLTTVRDCTTAPQRLVGGRFTFPPSKISNFPQIVFTADDYSRLGPEEFLNDTIIDWYLLHVRYTLEQKNPEAAKRCYFFNSFFYKKLSEKSGGELPSGVEAPAKKTELQALINYFKVKNWTRDVDIFSKDYVFVPIHDHLHWSVVVVCHPGALLGGADLQSVDLQTGEDENKRIAPRPRPFFLHLDSLGATGGHSSACTTALKHYLNNEWRFKTVDENAPADSVPRLWAAASGKSDEPSGKVSRNLFSACKYTRPLVPRQDNHCDCGLFVCASVEYFVFRLPPSLNEEAVKELANRYTKDGIDLWEGSEEGFYPGFLTPHWYPPSNASALRWEMCHMALQGMAQAAGLLKDDGSWNLEPAPPGTGTLLSGLMEEMDNVLAKRKENWYIRPEAWLEKGLVNKLKRQQGRERREEVERENERQKKEKEELRDKTAAAALRRRNQNLNREENSTQQGDTQDDEFPRLSKPDIQFGIELDLAERDAPEEVIDVTEKPPEKMLAISRKPRPVKTFAQQTVIKSDSECSGATANDSSSIESESEREEIVIDHYECKEGLVVQQKRKKKRKRRKRRSGVLGAQTEQGAAMTEIYKKMSSDLGLR